MPQSLSSSSPQEVQINAQTWHKCGVVMSSIVSSNAIARQTDAQSKVMRIPVSNSGKEACCIF
ncbi:hypothetical protein [Mucilaginibacter inviolabilis]|uniref:hypothetical protein n=1 Tax=Mucilaginibacter inviolabilis TaxID=2714892 RepID=UPI00140E5E7E|nr:hypothetical protein [Mucilaginibacter inviolabilis]